MKLKCKSSLLNSSHTRYLYIAGNVYIGEDQGYETHVEDEHGNSHIFDDEAIGLYFKIMPDSYNEDDDAGIEVNIVVNMPNFDE